MSFRMADVPAARSATARSHSRPTSVRPSARTQNIRAQSASPRTVWYRLDAANTPVASHPLTVKALQHNAGAYGRFMPQYPDEPHAEALPLPTSILKASPPARPKPPMRSSKVEAAAEEATAALVVEAAARRESDLWLRVVLPAVTWLFGWVEFQLGSSQMPPLVAKEHRAAFAAAIETVTVAMRGQPERLAAATWRAMVALLNHFVARVEPLQNAIHTLEAQATASKLEIAELRAALASAERAAAEHQANEILRREAALRGPPIKVGDERGENSEDVSRRVKDHTPVAADRRPSASLQPAENDAVRQSAVPQRNSEAVNYVSSISAELEDVRKTLMDAQRELLLERKAKQHAQEMLQQARAQRGVHGDDVLPGASSSGGGDDDNDDDDDDGDDDDDAQHEMMNEEEETRRMLAMVRTGSARRTTISHLVSADNSILERLEQQLGEERRKRTFLEGLRTQMAASVGEFYVRELEDKLRQEKVLDPEAPLSESALDELDDAKHSGSGIDAETQYDRADAGGDDDGDEDEDGFDEDEADNTGTGRPAPRSLRRSVVSVSGSVGKRSRKAGAIVAALGGGRRGAGGAGGAGANTILNMRQLSWTVQAIIDDKLKRDAVDELEHRQKQMLNTYVPEFFVHKHGLRDVANIKMGAFKQGLDAAARCGNRRAYVFGVLAGYMPFDDDELLLLREPYACQFYLELERRAMRASSADTDRSDGSLVWLPIDRAIELMRNEFKHARAADMCVARPLGPTHLPHARRMPMMPMIFVLTPPMFAPTQVEVLVSGGGVAPSAR